MLFLLCGFQRDLLINIPPHKYRTFQTTTFIWVYFPQMTLQFLTMKNLLKFFNKVNKILQWKYTSLSVIYFIKYFCGGFGKILISNFIYVIFHISYHRIFAYIALIWWGNITSHWTTNMIILSQTSTHFPMIKTELVQQRTKEYYHMIKMKSHPFTWSHLKIVMWTLMTLVGRSFIIQRRVFWLEKHIFSPCWMKAVLLMLLK